MSSESNSPTETTTVMPTLLKLSDDAIGMVRELLQYSLLLNISIVDSLRALRLEVNPATGNLVPSSAYIEGYNTMIADLDAKVDAAMKNDNADAAPTPTEKFLTEVLFSQDSSSDEVN